METRISSGVGTTHGLPQGDFQPWQGVRKKFLMVLPTRKSLYLRIPLVNIGGSRNNLDHLGDLSNLTINPSRATSAPRWWLHTWSTYPPIILVHMTGQPWINSMQ